MKREWITIMQRKKRLKLTFGQRITHYFVVPFLLITPGMTVFYYFKGYVTENYSEILSAEELIKPSIPFLVLAIVFVFIQYRRLNLKEIAINYSDDQFQEAVKKTIGDLKWKIKVNQKDFFRATRPSNWTGSWGEMITIIKYKDRLLLNSICNPDNISSVSSYGWNKRNLKTFLTNLVETIQGSTNMK